MVLIFAQLVVLIFVQLVVLIFAKLGPEPAFGRLGLGGSSGGYSSHGYTSHASLRTYGAQLGGDRLFFRRLTKHFWLQKKVGQVLHPFELR